MVLAGDEIRFTPTPPVHANDRGPVSGDMKKAVRQCEAELVPRLRWEKAADALIQKSQGRLNAIPGFPPYGWLSDAPIWQRYEAQLEEAYAAGDIERLKAILETRESHARALFEL
jgi:hypothetical protein